MGVPGSANFLLAGSQGYRIERSLRFNSADSAYLNRTPASAGNRKTMTFSFWVKRSGLSVQQAIFSAGTVSDNNIQFDSTGVLQINMRNGGSASNVFLITTQVFRDPSAWYHFVIALDTTQATASNRARIYVNGVEITSFGTTTYPTQNNDLNSFNNNVAHYIGQTGVGGSAYFTDAYLTEINFIDGQALTPSSFGETDVVTGAWKPKKYTGTYGTNGFYLNFSDNSGTTSTTLGKDSSGNGNNWTPNNFSVTAGAGNDSLIDTPTPYADGGNGRGNYCTLNPLDATLTLSNGNLDWSAPSNVERGARGTFAVSSGKWYFEHTAKGQTFELVGWAVQAQNNNSIIPTGVGASTWAYYLFDLKTYNNATASAVYGTAASSGDIIMVALDLDNSKIYWGRNGTWFNSGNPATGTNAAYTDVSGTLFPWVQQYNQTSSINFGQRPFAYTPPSGFVALNTRNLPEPSIKKPSNYMDTVLYTGTGSALTPTSSLGFSPDLVWIKGRSGATDHALYDAVRGAEKRLESNITDAEVTSDGGVTAFNTAGFTLGTLAQVNTNTATYAAWCWDESATPGFDIVTYTGNGSNRTIAHSLGVAPKMIIVKDRTSGTNNWIVGHDSIAWTNRLYLNDTSVSTAASTTWNNTAPTSSVFSVGTSTQTNTNGNNYVAYLWSEIAGFSKFGSYTGNGSTDGPFVFCGFRPRWVMIKRTDGIGSWFILDTARGSYNVVNSYVIANASNVEATDLSWDILSNGFKLRSSYADINTSSGTFVFAAFSEAPFKYALAR